MFLRFPNGDELGGVGIMGADLCIDGGFEETDGCPLADGR